MSARFLAVRSTLLAMAAVATACASSDAVQAEAPASPQPVRIAVLPARWVTTNPASQLDTTRELSRALAAAQGVTVSDRALAGHALAGEQDSCVEDTECVRRIGGRLKADWAVAVKLAELSQTVIVRASMVDVAGGTGQRTLQEVVQPATDDRLRATIQRMGAELARPFAPEPEPEQSAWYEEWWVWTIGGVVVAGAITATVVGTSLDEEPEPEPDVVITPP